MNSNNMLHVCARCHKLVGADHKCSAKRDYRVKKDKESDKVRSSFEWKKLTRLIKQRDGGIDQAAINGLDGDPYVEYRNLEVHHITPINEDKSKAFEPDNLITLSTRTHKLAERGEIEASKLREIAVRNTKDSGLF